MKHKKILAGRAHNAEIVDATAGALTTMLAVFHVHGVIGKPGVEHPAPLKRIELTAICTAILPSYLHLQHVLAAKSLRMLSGCQGWGTVSNSLVSTEPRSMCRARAWPEGNPASRPKAHSQERLCSCKHREDNIALVYCF